MAELVWRETYDRGVELFGGQRPGTQLEADLVERFEQHPQAVAAAVEKLGERFAAGRVHSPWPLVLRELALSPDRDAIRVSDESDRARAVHLAERCVEHALMFASESEMLAELFGARGRLEPWRDDVALRARMVSLWQGRQAAAQLVESEQLERAERWKRANPHRTNHVVTPPDPDPDIPW